MKKWLVIDIWWTTISWWLYNEEVNDIENITTFDTWEYSFDNVLNLIDSIVVNYKDKIIDILWISLNWQVNNWYVYFSRILWWVVNKDISKILEEKYKIPTKIENDVNCMALWYTYLSKTSSDYTMLLNIWTWLRSSYVYEWKLLKWCKWFFWEIRDSIFVEELNNELNLNDLVCWRWLSNIYNLLFWINLSSKQIYYNFKNWEEKWIMAVNIFLKYFIQLLERISYMYNPEEIVIDWSLKIIVKDNIEFILNKYLEKCEQHFVANIKIVDYENTNLYGALLI